MLPHCQKTFYFIQKSFISYYSVLKLITKNFRHSVPLKKSKVLRFLTKAIYFEFHYPLTLALLTMLSGVISHLYYMQTDDLIQTETYGNYEFLSCATKQLSKCEVLAKSEIFVFPFAKSQIIMLSFAKAKDFSRNVKYDS
ncbi:hypothetical protein T03_1313 [Trichinella britovi]|uniref:Uncharacterized protein n=1 Tax=Trichinella britovi TaxID=45882 RepID=A0A0V1DIX1_TRIBR|nr:hypothetical protein T03_1313 [Trichinella britovi]